MAKFSKSEAIKFGWNTTLKNLVFFILLLLIILGINMGFGFFKSFVGDSGLAAVVSIVSWIVQVIVSVGMIRIALKFVDGQRAKYDDLFLEYKNYGKLISYFIGSFTYGIIIVVGLILLIIPGVYLGIRLSFATYFIVDKNLNFVEALKASWNVTRGQAFNLFLLGIFLFVINILGLVALVVGLFVTAPTSFLAHAYVYRKLVNS